MSGSEAVRARKYPTMQPSSSSRHRILSSRSAALLCALLPSGCLWDALIDDPETTSGTSSSTSEPPTTAELPTGESTVPDPTTGSPSTSADGDTSGGDSTGAVTSGVDTGTTAGQTSTSGEASSTSDTSDTSGSSSTSDTTTDGPACDQAPGAPGSTIALARLHGSDVVQANDVAIDASGNIYVVGQFTKEMQINDVPQPQPQPLINPLVSAPFISKFACDGTHEWTKMAATTGNSAARALVISDSQEIFMTGWFTKALNFPGVPAIDPNVSTTVFVAKVSPSGDFLDTGTLALEATVGNAIVRDAVGNLFVAGACNSGGKPGILMAKLTKDLGTTALKCLPGGTATSAGLAADGLVVGGRMNTDLVALSKCTPINKPPVVPDDEKGQDGFVAKILPDLSNTATGTWCTSIASTSTDSVDDLAVNNNTVTAVGFSVGGVDALKTSAKCGGNVIGDAGAFVAPINLDSGTCEVATYHAGGTNRIHAIDSTSGGTNYIAGQFAGMLKDMNATTATFFLAKDANLAWAKQAVAVDMTSPKSLGSGIAVTDRVAVIGYTTTAGNVAYDGIPAAKSTDSFLLVLWP